MLAMDVARDPQSAAPPLQRHSPMSSRLVIPVLAIAALAAPSARADQLNGGKVKMEIRLPSESDPSSFITPTAIRLASYFNEARCSCAKGGETELYQVRYTWMTEPTAAVSKPLEIWVGRGCKSDNPDVVRANCEKLDPIPDPDALTQTVNHTYDLDITLAPKTATCSSEEFTAEHWAVTETSDAVWDADNQFELAIKADLLAPPVPTTLTVGARENGIALQWDAITDRADDIKYFQALCAKSDGSLAHDSPTDTARYQTARTLCAASTDPALTKATLTNDVGGTAATLPVRLGQLDPLFVCGQSDGSRATSINLSGLDNDQDYFVVLLAVDATGNVAGTYVDRPIKPQAVIDFWEEINNENSAIQGGFCVAQVGRGGGGGGSAIAIFLAGLIAVRRRRRGPARRRTSIGLLALLVAIPLVGRATDAAAQVSYSPYWQDEPDDDLGLPEVRWHVGLRLGPYRPSIDSSFMSSPGPYARTFRNDSVLFAVDLHRLWQMSFGQVGVGLTAGYYSNSANAFENGSLPSNPDRPRAAGNLTRLSIVPTALTVEYRASIFDDQFGVPLVPYLRGGVAYDVWWIKNPGDHLAVTCATCEDKALGASIGLVAAAGIAIRAERIDGDAARSMRDSGLEHAGFFAEVELGWIDGFGNDTKLSVGDTTWFGGIDFEF
jgi:hypothetical protein